MIAFVYAHMLAQRPLGWVASVLDIPQGVAAETGGIGDDIRVELADASFAIEVQAKHGQAAGRELSETLRQAMGRAPATSSDLLVLAIGRGSSKALYTSFVRDLDRHRSGRLTSPGPVMCDLIELVPGVGSLLSRLYVTPIDVDRTSDAERRIAVELIAGWLQDPTQASLAYTVFEADAQAISAVRLFRTRADLIDLLRARGIQVKRPDRVARLHDQLDVTRDLLAGCQAEVALAQLDKIERALEGSGFEPQARYRLYQQRGAAMLILREWAAAELWARRAVEIEQGDFTARITLTQALIEQGKIQESEGVATAAVQHDASQDAGWIALAAVASASGAAPPTPPHGVATSLRFRLAALRDAAARGEWETVKQDAPGLLRQDSPPPEVFLLAAQAESAGPPGDVVEWSRVAFLADEALKGFKAAAPSLRAQALAIRSTAKHHTGDQEGAEADLRHARELAPDDPDLAGDLAQRLARRGHIAEALQVLAHRVTEGSARLLAQRAGLLTLTDRHRAQADLARSVESLRDEKDPHPARLQIADVALQLGDLELARAMLAEVPSEGSPHEFSRLILLARIAVEDEEWVRAIKLYHAAAEAHSTGRSDVLIELAHQLGSHRRFPEAVATLQAIPLADLPEHGRQLLVAGLLETRALVAAAALIEHERGSSGTMPAWAIRAALELAMLQEDTQAAIARLNELLEVDGGNVEVRLELVRQLIEIEAHQEAARHLARLAGVDLSPSQEMQLATLLLAVGEEAAAISRGVAALRRAPTDRNLHRQLVLLAIRAKRPPPAVTEVGPDTHVVLRGPNGERRTITLWATPPHDALRHELSLEAAGELNLLGLRVGGTVCIQGQVLEVVQITTAQAFLVADTMERYEERFFTAPPFLRKVSLGDPNGPNAFAGFLALATEQNARDADLIKRYREHGLPLGLLAGLLGTTTADLMDTLPDPTSGAGVLFVQWVEPEARAVSNTAARNARSIVLAPSAACTLHDLGLLPAVLARYHTLVAESCWRELEAWARAAEQDEENGASRAGITQDGRPFVRSLEAGSPELVARAMHARARCEFLRSATRRPRPLTSIASAGSTSEEQRRTFGPPSYDAVQLARAEAVPLCADDLGLRLYLRAELGGPSICTIDLIQVLVEEGRISSEEYREAMVRLTRRGFAFLPPHPSTLVWAADNAKAIGGETVRRVFEGLAQDGMSLGGAAEVVARAVREVALATVQLSTPRLITLQAFAALTTQWAQPSVASALRGAARRNVGLLPGAVEQVEAAIRAMVQEAP